MVFKPKRIIELGRDCEDFEPVKREVEIQLPNIGIIDKLETDLEGMPLTSRNDKLPDRTPKPKKLVVDCKFSEECLERVKYEIPTRVRYIEGIMPLGDCVGVKFSKEDERLLRENLATLEDGLEIRIKTPYF